MSAGRILRGFGSQGYHKPSRSVRRWQAGAVVVGLLVAVTPATTAAPRPESSAVYDALASHSADNSLDVVDLRTEYARNPLGLDVTRPRLSWVLESDERGQRQTAYQVVVSWRAGGRERTWDSGKVRSEQSVNVPYAGPALTSRTRYHWKVRVWDKDGDRSDWSGPARWETALLHPSEWRAEWIAAPRDDDPPPALDGAHWIWYPEGDPGESAPAATRYLRRSLAIDPGRTVTRARALLTADNQFTAYLNGAQVAASDGTTSAWQHAVLVDLTDQLRSGPNTLAVAATNAGGAAGFIGVLEIEFADGSTTTVRTDEQWKAFDAEVTGWADVGFDDAGWPAALSIAPYGEGVWTCCGGVQVPEESRDPLLRTDFRVSKPVRQARVYLSGLGHHELRINGRKVGDSVLETDVNDYDERVGYTTYDVTPYLKGDDNAIGVLLGRGFYDVHQTTPLEWHLAPWRDDPKLLLQLEIRYQDGSTQTVVSGGGWKTTPGPIVYDSVFGGEDYDARLESPGWDTASFDASQWQPARIATPPGGRLVATNNDPIKVVETLRPVDMTEPEPGVYVFDLGHTITGWGRLAVSGAAGTTITLRYGQKLLSDGTVDFHNSWHGGRSQTDRYTLEGRGQETWEPRFSFKGFRYIQVSGLSGAPSLGTVVGRYVHSAVESTGSFDSSNSLYNAFHDGTRRTILGNLEGFPAQDPFFERSGWTGDVAISSQVMIYNFDLARFFTEWLEDIRDSQLPSGHIPVIIPSPGWGYTSWGTPSPIWTAVYPMIAWRMYENYGDRRVLAEHYAAIKSYIEREISLLDGGIVANEFLGDWLAPGYAVPPEDSRLASTAYVYRQLAIVSDMAAVLGKTDDAARYASQAALVRDRFNATFLNESEGYYETAQDPEYRQTSNLLPLAFGMVPEGMKQQVVDNLVADIRARDDHLDTGILGTAVLLPVLTENGHADLAHAIANQRTYPSWGEWYVNGADTMWESWGLDPRSRSHIVFGMIDQWFIEDLAGIGAEAPGYRKFRIRPHLGGGLAEAKAKYESVHGEIESEWEVDGDRFTLEVTVPVNTTATVYVPTGDPDSMTEGGVRAARAEAVRLVGVEDGYAVYDVGSGTYRFRSML